MKVHFAGPSSIGKTTLAKGLEITSNLEFVSGSISDLIPETKEVSHLEMLNQPNESLYLQDYQVSNLRSKLYADKLDYVTDRSFLDVAAYFWYKQAKSIPACEIEHFFELNKMLCNKHCTHLILLSLRIDQIKEWFIEDNNKRITSGYFQTLISSLMELVLEAWGAKPVKMITTISKGVFKYTHLEYGASEYLLESPYGSTKVLKIFELDKYIRETLIHQFIHS